MKRFLFIISVASSLFITIFINSSNKETQENTHDTHETHETTVSTDQNKNNLPTKQEIRLTTDILNIIDGRVGLMDAEKIRGINYMIQEIAKIQYGILDKTTGNRIGKYPFNNQVYTLKKLVKVESDYNNNIPEALSELLKKLKTDLAQITDPNLESGRGSKHFMRILIHEWATKANKLNSLVVRWSDLPESDDQETFRKTLTSFKLTDSYCTDLLQFLAVLKRSCPKASKLYEDKYHKHA